MLCLASGLLTAQIAASGFVLAWTHSIEKLRWEESWRVTPAALVLEEARIRGSGAGMEPPPGARLKDGVWHYEVERVLPSLLLSHSPWAEEYELCIDGECRKLSAILPGLADEAVVRLSPC